jgi:hypothetical protein
MRHDLARVERLGFSRAATAVALRCAATCPNLAFHPVARPAIGIGMLSVTPGSDGSYSFHTQVAVLRDGALPETLADWLEPRFPEMGVILSSEADGSLPWKLGGLINVSRHPRLAQFVSEPGDRLRALPPGIVSGRPRRVGISVPCLCPFRSECVRQLPAFFLPEPDGLERDLITDAEATWSTWADLHAAFDDHAHPARVALRSLADWRRRGEHVA